MPRLARSKPRSRTGSLPARKRRSRLPRTGYRAVAVKTRRQELLKLIEHGIRRRKLPFPAANGPISWDPPSSGDSAAKPVSVWA
jgi:hypothetical protein